MVPKVGSPRHTTLFLSNFSLWETAKPISASATSASEQTWMDRLMDNTPHIQVFDTSKGIDLILNNGEHNHVAGHHDHDGHNHAVEPHICNSTANALILAGNTFKALLCSTSPMKHIIWHVTTPSANVSSTPTALSAGNFPLRNRPKPL